MHAYPIYLLRQVSKVGPVRFVSIISLNDLWMQAPYDAMALRSCTQAGRQMMQVPCRPQGSILLRRQGMMRACQRSEPRTTMRGRQGATSACLLRRAGCTVQRRWWLQVGSRPPGCIESDRDGWLTPDRNQAAQPATTPNPGGGGVAGGNGWRIDRNQTDGQKSSEERCGAERNGMERN
jgi:hypothetical protein